MPYQSHKKPKWSVEGKNRRILTVTIAVLLFVLIIILIAVGVSRHKTTESDKSIRNAESDITQQTIPVKDYFTDIREGYDLPYTIAVNTKQNIVTVYEKDPANGTYTKPVKAFICSTGLNDVTISLMKQYDSEGKANGYYKNGLSYTSDYYDDSGAWHGLDGNTCTPYAVRICSSILFHSVPYTVNGDRSSLQEGEYDKLGSQASHGCIRMPVTDIKWIYDHCPQGTCVAVYADDEIAEPLGKPTAKKIGSIPLSDPRHGWDPTDPDPSNPWKR